MKALIRAATAAAATVIVAAVWPAGMLTLPGRVRAKLMKVKLDTENLLADHLCRNDHPRIVVPERSSMTWIREGL